MSQEPRDYKLDIRCSLNSKKDSTCSEPFSPQTFRQTKQPLPPPESIEEEDEKAYEEQFSAFLYKKPYINSILKASKQYRTIVQKLKELAVANDQLATILQSDCI